MSSPPLPPGVNASQIPFGAPPPGIIPNFVNPPTLVEGLIAASTTTLILALLLLSARLYSTTRITHSIGSDDYIAIASFVLSLAYTSINIENRGIARHNWDLPLSDFTLKSMIFFFVSFFLGTLAGLFADLSILLLLLRIFSVNKRFKIAVYAGIAWTVLLHVIAILVDSIMCAPWPGESFNSPAVQVRCVRSDLWLLVSAVLEVLFDIYVFILPLPVIWRLQMGAKRKAGISMIFMTASM